MVKLIVSFSCSTPFGIKDYCTNQVWLEITSLLYECSTPFGIKDYCTNNLVFDQNDGSTCSTPFGIKDYCTFQRIFSTTASSGAQRLSASKITAPSL